MHSLATNVLATVSALSPDLHEIGSWGPHARSGKMMIIIFQLAAMLMAAKLLGWLVERIKVPGVIGELLAGVIIGPYLLGSMIEIPLGVHRVPLFPMPTEAGQWPVNDVIWAIAQFASIVLLFVTGLHTDLKQFLKYIAPASLVATLGFVLPFVLGAGVVFIPPFANLARATPGEPILFSALYMGAILAATSIGITARVLGDIGKLDTPEGVTILGAAVLDDVLGIIAMAIVGGIVTGGAVSASGIGFVALKAFGFWIGLTCVVFFLARPIEWVLTRIRYSGAMVGLGLAIAFFCSGMAESFGLAFIIGAYSVGLGLSRTDMSRKLMEQLEPINAFIVPIFFAALGMLVNVKAMLASPSVIIFGLVIAAVAIAGKLIGCGWAATKTGFNKRGAIRVGLGMMPRGEVALIVAGVGLSSKIIGEVVFGVSILMTLITTIVAPILLVPFFRGGSGRKNPDEETPKLPSLSELPPIEIQLPPSLKQMYIDRLLQAVEKVGWHPSYDRADEDIYLLRSRGDAAQITFDENTLSIRASDSRQVEFEEIAQLVQITLLDDVQAVKVLTPPSLPPVRTGPEVSENPPA